MIGYLMSCGTPKGLGVSGDGQLKPVPQSPNCVSSQADTSDKVHYMPPWNFSDPETAKIKIKQCINDFGGATIKSEGSNYIHAVFVSGWMKYRDDVEFYFDEAEKHIHFRSASRIGYGDMGVNRKRMKKLKSMYLEQ